MARSSNLKNPLFLSWPCGSPRCREIVSSPSTSAILYHYIYIYVYFMYAPQETKNREEWRRTAAIYVTRDAAASRCHRVIRQKNFKTTCSYNLVATTIFLDVIPSPYFKRMSNLDSRTLSTIFWSNFPIIASYRK